MFHAKDVMATDLVTVTPETPIFEALRILVEANITGLPVVDHENNLKGIVSEKDLLQLLYNAAAGNDAVSSIMTENVTTFDVDDDLVDVCECLINNAFRRVPILSQGKLAGIISRRDIIRFILKVRKSETK